MTKQGGYIEIERPPVLRGTTEQKLEQIQRYLQRLSEQLTEAVNKEGENDGR